MTYQEVLRKLILPLLIVHLATPFNANSQGIKYDDLYAELRNLSPQQAFNRLFIYQNQDPYFANTYVQLGDAAEKILQNLDPLRDFELVNYWSGNAVLYYSLFPAYLKGSEVRRNREYYANLPIETAGRRLDDEDVLDYVFLRTTLCNNFKDSVTLIYRALEKSKDHYNNCVRIFNQINNSYDNLNELLLQADQAFISLMQSLDNEFKQCIKSFDSYKSLLEKFPIGDYDQTYIMRKIETYRLEGLTNSDFLKDTFQLWDYGTWVASFQETYSNDIVSLRHEIASTQKLFTDNRRKISLSEFVGPDEKYASFDELFLFRLGKYDNNSLVRELFRYLSSRQDFLLQGKSPLNNATDSASALINRKLRYYHRLALQQISSGMMLEELKNSINPERINRFKEFFEQNYQGESGLKRFTEDEKHLLAQSMDNALQNLKVYLDNENTTRLMLGNATGSRGLSIPLYNVSPDSSSYKTLTHVTQCVSYQQGEPRYVSGFIQRQGRSPVAFAAKVNEERKVDWVREVGAKGRDILPQGDMAKQIFGFDGGCMVMVAGKTDNEYRSTLIRIDEKGKDLFSKALEINAAPVFYHFDEINQQSIMGFANKDADTLDVYNSFIISRADSLGNIEWKTTVQIQGNLVDVVRTENKYLAFFNFQSFEINGNRLDAGQNSNHLAHVIVELSPAGEVINHTPIVSNESFEIDRVFSISSNEINLIGYTIDPFLSRDKLRYAIVTPEGNIIYKNF